MLQNARVTVFTVCELLRESQQEDSTLCIPLCGNIPFDGNFYKLIKIEKMNLKLIKK